MKLFLRGASIARKQSAKGDAAEAQAGMSEKLSSRDRAGVGEAVIQGIHVQPFVKTPSRFSSTLAIIVHAAASAALNPSGNGPSGFVANLTASASLLV